MATAQDTRIDQLTERVERLEAQMQKLSDLEQGDPAAHLWADKETARQAFRHMFAELGIQDRTPIGALELQRRMAQTSLAFNEFSRGIIEMRDE